MTEDGDAWRSIAFPKNAGVPTDVTRFRGVLVALTERGLYRLDTDPPAQVAAVKTQDGRTPFEHFDLFCGAPLAVFENELYAGSQRDGSLWKIVEAR